MSDRKWTPAQEKAINARGRRVLVSAAAGSGKTSVLTERVKNILTDEDNKCGVSDILVVTFTRKAAEEMRDRIYKALMKASKDNPNSDSLRQQMILLPTADISTIDSFCSKIVKENFAKADISVDFTLLDEKENIEIINEAVDFVLEELYSENDPSFIQLTNMFSDEKSDETLSDIIKKLYNFSRSNSSPEIYLNSLTQMFDPQSDLNETLWASYIYKYIRLFCDCYIKRFEKCLSIIENSSDFTPKYYNKLSTNLNNVSELLVLCNSRNWDGMVKRIEEGILFTERTPVKESNNKKITEAAFSEFKKNSEKLKELNLPTIEEHKNDCKVLYPIVYKLCESVKRLNNVAENIKKERNTYYFDDILHKCVGLLVNFKSDGSWDRTPIAQELCEKYKEILIDEYQDTNEAQNIIFEALSDNGNNLYCVGDVKQSIYKFRLASPELFIDLKKKLGEFDDEENPSLICLDSNFRSRRGITQITNTLFKSLMSEEVGEIDYDDKEELKFGAAYYPEKDTPDCELLCFDFKEFYPKEAIVKEAEEIAQYIENILASNTLISDGSEQRRVKESDICILLRVAKDRINFYSDALSKKGIPSNAVIDGNIGENKEILLMTSFMKVISNPLLDVPLISVLFSPVFGFTADELAEIRMVGCSEELYPCLCEYAKTHPKAERFIHKLNLYRNISVSYPVNEFVRFIVRDTDIANIYSASRDGAYRKGNIRSFIDFADKFSQNGRVGLGAFIRSLDCALDSGKMRTYAGVNAPSGVQIMTIHSSKGLEFPYVIVADCTKELKRNEWKNQLKISRATGVGMKIRDDSQFKIYNTLSSVGTELDIYFGATSEWLRLLYVAATRAKEHVTFVTPFIKSSGMENRLLINKYLSTDKNGQLHPFAVYNTKSFSEWILSSLIDHPDCQIVRDLSGIKIYEHKDSGFSIDVSSEIEIKENLSVEQSLPSPVDEELLKKIEERTKPIDDFDSSFVLAKVTASSLENNKEERAYFARRKPKFMQKSITGADRGDAIHKFFEICDIESAAFDCEKEKRRLLDKNQITDEEFDVINSDAVNAFFTSNVGKRLLNSKKVLREYEFSFLKKAGDVYDDVHPALVNEKIVIQGKLDCAFVESDGIVLIDYKTDNITDEDKFREIYFPQINIYAESLEECTGINVKERYIYSFKLNKFINL